jgi:F-type H+-transporting ATPase subunit delta
MNHSKIPVRYAKALISSAKEQGILDSVRTDMENFMGLIKKVPDLSELLQSPIIRPAKKLEVLSAIFTGKVQPLTLSFFRLAVKNNREDHLSGMARMYIEMYKKVKGIKIANLKTATPIDKGTRDELIRMIRKTFNAEIELHEETDKELVGGFILQVENQQLDASISGQLKKIKRELIS